MRLWHGRSPPAAVRRHSDAACSTCLASCTRTRTGPFPAVRGRAGQSCADRHGPAGGRRRHDSRPGGPGDGHGLPRRTDRPPAGLAPHRRRHATAASRRRVRQSSEPSCSPSRCESPPPHRTEPCRTPPGALCAARRRSAREARLHPGLSNRATASPRSPDVSQPRPEPDRPVSSLPVRPPATELPMVTLGAARPGVRVRVVVTLPSYGPLCGAPWTGVSDAGCDPW